MIHCQQCEHWGGSRDGRDSYSSIEVVAHRRDLLTSGPAGCGRVPDYRGANRGGCGDRPNCSVRMGSSRSLSVCSVYAFASLSMKIKCPGCGSLLQIPETAAGKVVKCKCGKQLRAPAAKTGAPAAKPAAPAAAAKPTAQRPAPQRPAAQRPAPQPPAAAAPPALDLFDDLTETDLGSVKAVHTPGLANPYQAAAPAGGSGHYMSDANAEGAGELGPRPIPLILIAIHSVFGTLAYGALAVLMVGMLGLLAAATSTVEAETGEAQGATAEIAAAGVVALVPIVITTVLGLACVISCFVRGKLPWFILLFSYAMSSVMHIMSVVASAMQAEWMRLGGGIFFILLALTILTYLHAKAPRLYYAGASLKVKSAITHDILGAILGGCLGFILFFYNRT